MDTTTIPCNDNDSEHDEANEECATQPLLLQSSASASQDGNLSTIAIKLPTSAYKTNTINVNPENRILFKFGHIVNRRFSRTEYRRSYRDKWTRINVGLLTISLLSVILICISMNLTIDKPSPQLIVDVPPIDIDLVGQEGKLYTYTDTFVSKHFELFMNYNKML